jgi:predicted AAA+ superfamily ATPase
MIKRDDYIRKIEPFINKDIVKVLTGIRRSGKSTLLELLREALIGKGAGNDLFWSINFEDLEQSNKSIQDIQKEVRQFCEDKQVPCYLFFDEVQELDGWEKLINSLRLISNADIYITGSNSNLLSGELATYLAGRYIEIPIYPLSFKEIYQYESQQAEEVHLTELFGRYIRLGGLPFIYASKLSESAAHSYLQDIYQSIMLKDIIARYGIRDIELLNRIFKFFFDNLSQTLSTASISKYLKSENRSVSHETIYNYINYAVEACLIYLVPRYDLRGKRLLSFQEKLFLADLGIREAVYGYNQRDISQVLENIVYLELLRRGYKVNIGKIDVQEVDFIATRGAEKLYYQVAYLLADNETVEREFGSLEKIQDNFPKFVLSLDAFDRGRNGIRHKNIIDFLLE